MTGPVQPDLNAALDRLRNGSDTGEISDITRFETGIELHADPALNARGQFRSPSGRLLELDIDVQGQGDWIALHVALPLPDLSGLGYVGFACRSAAQDEVMIRPCLRSSTEDGFADSFFPRHILCTPEPRDHVDALHPATARTLPQTARWRELVLFLPRETLVWHLHDLRLFAV